MVDQVAGLPLVGLRWRIKRGGGCPPVPERKGTRLGETSANDATRVFAFPNAGQVFQVVEGCKAQVPAFYLGISAWGKRSIEANLTFVTRHNTQVDPNSSHLSFFGSSLSSVFGVIAPSGSDTLSQLLSVPALLSLFLPRSRIAPLIRWLRS